MHESPVLKVENIWSGELDHECQHEHNLRRLQTSDTVMVLQKARYCAGWHQLSVVYHFLAIAGALDSGIPITQGTLTSRGTESSDITGGPHVLVHHVKPLKCTRVTFHGCISVVVEPEPYV